MYSSAISTIVGVSKLCVCGVSCTIGVSKLCAMGDVFFLLMLFLDLDSTFFL